jgi:hypothetical protein
VIEGPPPSPPDGGFGLNPPPGTAIPVARPASPLSEADFQAIREAVAARRPIRRAARVATCSALSILVVAIGAVPIAMFSPSIENAVVAGALCIICHLEYAGARKMRQGLPAAASHLGWNQVVFIGLICLYCLNGMLEASSGKVIPPETRSRSSQISDIAKEIDSLFSSLTYVMYGMVMLLSATLQGWLAWYYFNRRPYLEALQRSTPEWIRRLLDELAE